jgi:release factor glutamine methyltransferase
MHFQKIRSEFPHISRGEYEQLVAEVLHTTREYVISHDTALSFSPQQANFLRKWLQKRSNGVPLAYLTNRKEFFGLEFFVNEHTLIPRPETEMLVERALTIRNEWQDESPILLDIGTGSGAIAVSLATHIQHANIIATDISPEALFVAQKNARIHGVSHRIEFIRSDILSEISFSNISHTFLLLLANLPYVPENLYENADKHTDTTGIRFEPRIAITSGEDGLDAYRILFEQLHDKRNLLPKKTVVLCEFLGDETQTIFFQSTIADTFPQSQIDILPDLSGRNRLAEITIQCS